MATQTEKTLNEHEVELTRLREQVDVLSSEVAQLRPLVAETVSLRAQLTAKAGDSARLDTVEKELA